MERKLDSGLILDYMKNLCTQLFLFCSSCVNKKKLVNAEQQIKATSWLHIICRHGLVPDNGLGTV